jgi:hypothetical protein
VEHGQTATESELAIRPRPRQTTSTITGYVLCLGLFVLTTTTVANI